MSTVDPTNGVAPGLFRRQDYSNAPASLGGTAMAADVQDIDSWIWHRSSLCTPGKNCVEVGHTDAGVIIRDSKSETALHAVNNASWTAFLARCRRLD
jgi:hypothetical protein